MYTKHVQGGVLSQNVHIGYITQALYCCIINPRRACAARVTVLGLCVCVCVCVSAALFSHLAQLRGKQEIRATSASHGQQK